LGANPGSAATKRVSADGTAWENRWLTVAT
jgi:hypothetical protein